MNILNLLLFCWTVALILFRPSIFGERYNIVVFGIFFTLSALIIIVQPRALRLDKKRLLALIIIYLCIFYFLIQGLILSAARETVINSCFLLFLTVPCIALIVSRNQEKILRYFIKIHYLLSISAIITFIIFLLRGVSIYKLPVIASLYELVQYAAFDPIRPLSNHILIFPYTVAWSTVDFFNISLYRFVGVYREPGVAQIFFITAFLLTFFVPAKHIKRKRMVLLAGSVLLFSAAGLLNLALALLVYSYFNSSAKQKLIRAIRNPIVILFSIAAFCVLTFVALKSVRTKLTEISGSTRIESFQNGIRRLSDNLIFGEGYYNNFRKEEGVVTSENFLGLPGVSYQIGLAGLLLYLLVWMYSVLNLATRSTLCLYIPCFVTLLLSQPTYNDIFTWFLLLLKTNELFPLNTPVTSAALDKEANVVTPDLSAG